MTALGSAYANSYHAEADRIEKGYAYAKLTRLQKMALLSDWIAHTADHAGPISLMINLATQNQLSRVSKLSIQAGTILFSAFISYSGVHSCKKAMLAFNDRSSDDEINTSQSCLSFLFKTCCGINESESYYIRHRNYNTI